PYVHDLASRRLVSRLKLPGVLSRLNLTERIHLTPEGTTLKEAKRLTNALAAQGCKVFVLNYHSTSLLPGSNPYVRDDKDLSRFLIWLNDYCEYFFGELRGVAVTPDDLYSEALNARQVQSDLLSTKSVLAPMGEAL